MRAVKPIPARLRAGIWLLWAAGHPYDRLAFARGGACPTCSEHAAAWTPAHPRAGRSASWPWTTARTCGASCIRRIRRPTTYAEMVEFKRAVVRAMAGRRHRHASRSGDRRRAVHRGRLAAALCGADRGDRGHRLRGPAERPNQPRPPGLVGRAGQADGRFGRQAPHLLPPRRGQRRRPGEAARRPLRRSAGRAIWRSSSSRSRSIR